MKFKKSHILLISLISLFLLLSMSAVSAASDDASIAQATEINDIDAIDDMGNDILSDGDDGTGGDNTNPDDPGTDESTDPLPVSTTEIESGNKTYTFGSNITFEVIVKDNQSNPITNISQDNFKVYFKNSTAENFTEQKGFTFSDSVIKLDFDTNKTFPVENYIIKIVFLNSVIDGVNYTESDTTIYLNITKTNTTITADNKSYEIADDIIIHIIMKVESGKTLNFNKNNMKVYWIGGEEYKEIDFIKISGTNDIKLLNLTGLGKHTIFLNYTGNENCNASDCTIEVELNKTNTHIDASDVKVKKGEDVIIPFDVRMTSNNTINVNESDIIVYLDGDETDPINFTIVKDGIKLLNLTDEFGYYNVYIKYNGVENYSYPSVKTVKVSILENNTINVDNTINVNNHTHNVTIPINITVPVVNEDGNVTVTPLNFTKDNITLVLKYLDGEQNVTVTLDPSQYDLTGENGTYVINFITDHFDNSELTIIYANGTLNETEKTVTLKWAIDLYIEPQNLSADYQQGEFVFIVYDAYDIENDRENAVPLSNITITVGFKNGISFFTINGNSITIGPRDFTTDENGTIVIKNDKSYSLGSFSQSFLTAGNYNLTFRTKDHYIINETKEITVNKVQAEIIATPIVDEYEDGKVLNYIFQVINSNTGDAIESALVQFRIYSSNIDATRNGTTNSSGFYKSPNLNLWAGTYNLDLKSIDSNLICSAVKQTITLKQRDAVISASNRTILYGSGITVVATVKDKKTGNPVPNAYVLVKVYITSSKVSNYLVRTDSKGVVRFSTGLSVGKHKVILSMLDTNYKSGSLTRYVTVKKTTGQFSAPKVSTYYKSGKYYKVKLTNTKNKALMYASKINIKVYISKSRYYNLTGTTDGNGLVQFKITFKPGTYKVVVSSADKGYSAKAVTSQIKVSKSPIKIAPTSLKVKRYSYFKVKVTSTKSKKVLSGVKVKVRVYTGRKYKTYTIKTNKKGIASLKISQKRGKHKVVLSPGSPTYYYAKAITRTLTVTR